MTRFGIPKMLISDNGTQFKSRKIIEFCEKLKIQQSFSSVARPDTNGQVEASNMGVKKKIRRYQGKMGHRFAFRALGIQNYPTLIN